MSTGTIASATTAMRAHLGEQLDLRGADREGGEEELLEVRDRRHERADEMLLPHPGELAPAVERELNRALSAQHRRADTHRRRQRGDDLEREAFARK